MTRYGFPYLYQSASALFIGLLIAVVVNEVRDRSQANSLAIARRAAVRILLFAVALLVGVGACVIAFALGRGTLALELLALSCVGVSLLTAVVPALSLLGHDPVTQRRRLQPRVVAASIAGFALVLVTGV